MKSLKRAFLTVTAVLAQVFGASCPAAAQAAEGKIAFDLMHTVPICANAGKPDTWCTLAEAPKNADAAGMEERANAIIAQAKDPSAARITIAYFSFSNRKVLGLAPDGKTATGGLCAAGRAGIPIEGFFDVSYRDPSMFPALLAANCQGPSGRNVRVHFLGKTDTSNPDAIIWRLHHNKFLMVDTGVPSDKVYVNFSSGNLSSFGMSNHFDHWVTLQADRDTNLVKQQNCVIESLRKAIDTDGDGVDASEDDPEAYRTALNACLTKAKSLFSAKDSKWTERALDREGIAPLFSPEPTNQIARVLIDNINRVAPGGSISGAMQHFLHVQIALALQKAEARGVKVSLIMDDDVLTGESEVPGVGEFYKGYLDPKVSGFDISFLVTNAADHQMMHNKFLVMTNVDGKETRVFSGAGHFTTSGMRNNYENFYLSRNDGLSAKYAEFFKYLRGRAVDASVLGGSDAVPNPFAGALEKVYAAVQAVESGIDEVEPKELVVPNMKEALRVK
jgi:hypothetical protein